MQFTHDPITKLSTSLSKHTDNPDLDDLRAQLLKLRQEKFDRRKELIVGPRLHHSPLPPPPPAIKF